MKESEIQDNTELERMMLEKLDELAKFLYEKETITGEEFMHILNA